MQINDFDKYYNDYKPGLMGAKSAYAVLVPLIYKNREPYLLFEVRSDTLGRQPGEVCFPGGRMEKGETPLESAIRETEEELSIPRDCIRPIGEMDYIFLQSGAFLYPILGEIKEKDLKSLKPSKAEVKETFLVPFSFFLKNEPLLYHYELAPQPPKDFPYHLIGFKDSYPFRSGNIEVPIYQYHSHPIWGLTGRICMHLAKQIQPAAEKKPNKYQHIEHPIPPLYRSDSKILILGSFPSVKSREGMFFYHHPQNRFWRVIASITGEKSPETIDQKRNMLLKHHIALWDVIHSCDIIGSSDSSIKNVVTNDLSSILSSANIEQIYANGNTAGRLYQKYIAPQLDRNCTILPSTSPANASFSLERLTNVWKDALITDL